jgi:hypothetical protein
MWPDSLDLSKVLPLTKVWDWQEQRCILTRPDGEEVALAATAPAIAHERAR